MGVTSNEYKQGKNVTTGTGVPAHSAVAGDGYTDLTTGYQYTYTTAWEKMLSGQALTYFNEVQTTAAPNATIYANSLTAVSSTTNADFILRPKGTGAILGKIPDNAGGGNKRGIYAVDLQLFSDVGQPQDVASGAYAVITGGQYNEASGSNSTVSGGYNNTASGFGGSVMGGSGNRSVGSYSASGGVNNTINSSSSNGFGELNTVSGLEGSSAFGYANTITGGYHSNVFGGYNSATGYKHFLGGESNLATYSFGSTILGNSGTDNGCGKFVYSRSKWVRGDAQSSKVILIGRTTNATPKILYIDNADAPSGYELLLQADNSVRFKGTIIARQSGSTNTSAWDIDGLIQRGTTVGSTTLLISNVNVVQNTPAWGTPTLTADTSLGGLLVTVTGLSATNIQWTCVIDTTEVIYA